MIELCSGRHLPCFLSPQLVEIGSDIVGARQAELPPKFNHDRF
jgi:hypothetical protein